MTRTQAAVAAVVMVTAAGCGASTTQLPADASLVASAPAGTLLVGSTGSSLSEALADVYCDALTADGRAAQIRLRLGGMVSAVQLLQYGVVQVLVEPDGPLLTALDPAASAVSTGSVDSQLNSVLPGDVETLRPGAQLTSAAQATNILPLLNRGSATPALVGQLDAVSGALTGPAVATLVLDLTVRHESAAAAAQQLVDTFPAAAGGGDRSGAAGA